MRPACNLVKISEVYVKMFFDVATIEGHKMVINFGFKVENWLLFQQHIYLPQINVSDCPFQRPRRKSISVADFSWHFMFGLMDTFQLGTGFFLQISTFSCQSSFPYCSTFIYPLSRDGQRSLVATATDT